MTEDIVGLFGDFKPDFVKRYANLATDLEEAAKQYAAEVRSRAFPTDEFCFGVPKKP